MRERMSKRMSVRMSEGMSERMSERMSVRMSERVSVRVVVQTWHRSPTPQGDERRVCVRAENHLAISLTIRRRGARVLGGECCWPRFCWPFFAFIKAKSDDTVAQFFSGNFLSVQRIQERTLVDSHGRCHCVEDRPTKLQSHRY